MTQTIKAQKRIIIPIEIKPRITGKKKARSFVKRPVKNLIKKPLPAQSSKFLDTRQKIGRYGNTGRCVMSFDAILMTQNEETQR
jgi:hypothetical protein